MNTSDLLMRKLQQAGVRTVFVVVGGNAMFLNEALRSSDITYVAMHHEQAAVMAAEGYARQSGSIGVCITTSGPAATNAVTGIAGAFVDSTALLVVSGQPRTSELRHPGMPVGVRQVGTFELPAVDIVSPICKAAVRLRPEDDAEAVIVNLVHLAKSGRPGPVFLEVPLDVQSQLVHESDLEAHSESATSPDATFDIGRLQAALAQSRRPLVIAGHGVRASGSVPEFRRATRMLGIPVVLTQLAKDALPYEDALFVGHVGLRGDRPGNIAVAEADFVLTIGTSLHVQTTGYDVEGFAPRGELWITDFEGSVSGKNLKVQGQYGDLPVPDIIAVLSETAELRGSLSIDPWLEHLRSLKSQLSVMREPHRKSEDELNMYEVADCISRVSPESATIVVDAGLAFYVMGQTIRVKDSQRYIVSGGLGAMGYALPASIGASQATESPVICVLGDGSIQMNAQELATVGHMRPNLKIVLLNNAGYASIRNTQSSFFTDDFIGCGLESGLAMPNWCSLATAYSVPYRAAGSLQELLDVFAEEFESKGPCLIDVSCQVQQAIMPTIASRRNADGQLVSDPLHLMSPHVMNNGSDLTYN